MEARALDTYTEDDYYNFSEDVRADLIEGQIYFMSVPSRIHQRISGRIYRIIGNYIDANICPLIFHRLIFDSFKSRLPPLLSGRKRDCLTDYSIIAQFSFILASPVI